MKTIRHIAILAWCLLYMLVGCAPRAIIVEPVTPAVVRAKAEVKAATDSSKRVKESVGTVHAQAQGIAAEVGKATAEVDRLRSVAPGDFDALWTMMTDLKTQTWAHEIKARETVEQTIEQAVLQDAASKTLGALETTAVAHDKGIEQLKAHTAKVEKQAAVSGVYRTWIIVIAVSLGLLIAGWIALQIFKPAFLR